MNTTAEQPTPEPFGRSFSLRTFTLRALAFLLIFMALQAAWEWARGGWLERLWVQDLTVRSATALINLLTPDVSAVAQASRIVAPGGGLNVLFGCEGTDVVFMLTAAFLVFPLPVRIRVWGLATGLLWVFMLNQLRIAALFYTFRVDRGLFELLHGIAAPSLMIVLAGGFFHLWLRYADALEGNHLGPSETRSGA